MHKRLLTFFALVLLMGGVALATIIPANPANHGTYDDGAGHSGTWQVNVCCGGLNTITINELIPGHPGIANPVYIYHHTDATIPCDWYRMVKHTPWVPGTPGDPNATPPIPATLPSGGVAYYVWLKVTSTGPT